MPSSKGWRDPEEGRSDDVSSVADVVRRILATRPFARGVGIGRLAREWADVVGERLAAETRPARLEAGTLVVTASSGAWGTQVEFLSEEVRRRANEALGSQEIQRVRVSIEPPDRRG